MTRMIRKIFCAPAAAYQKDYTIGNANRSGDAVRDQNWLADSGHTRNYDGLGFARGNHRTRARQRI
jgi:hypothetical protein